MTHRGEHGTYEANTTLGSIESFIVVIFLSGNILDIFFFNIHEFDRIDLIRRSLLRARAGLLSM